MNTVPRPHIVDSVPTRAHGLHLFARNEPRFVPTDAQLEAIRHGHTARNAEHVREKLREEYRAGFDTPSAND